MCPVGTRGEKPGSRTGLSPRVVKFAAVAEALAAELIRRGNDTASATLLADVGVAIFRTGFNQWVDNSGSDDLASCLREAGTELANAVAPLSAARP
jgi:hypothetical protein